MTSQRTRIESLEALRAQVAQALTEQQAPAGGVVVQQRTAAALLERLGQPFTAKFGAIAGQQAIKVRYAPVLNVVAHANLPEGQVVFCALGYEPKETTLALATVEGIERRTADVFGALGLTPPAAFDRYGAFTDECVDWFRDVARPALTTLDENR